MKRSGDLWSEDQFGDPDTDTGPGGFAELSPGDAIGKFRIIRELGKGGMGAVYLAVNPTLQIEVAVKILPPSVVRDTPQVAGRFIREARLAARISHPNVVAVKDADLDPATGLYYIVLEYVSGGSLGDRLASSGALSEDEALRVVYDMAQALVAAEEHGIVHRDIKPDNIMLDARGIAKLADLGVARQAMAKSTNLTQEGSSIGTPAYMSPDQIRNAQDVDTRDDIYSLGATLYELLTGQPPFDGSTAYNIVSKVLSSPTPNPRDINPDISPSVASLCMKMMARSKAARHQNATALINDLERLSELNWGPESDPHQRETLAGDSNVLIPPSLEQMARRHANRYAESEYDQQDEGSGTSRTITWVLAGLLCLAVLGGVAMWLRDKSQPVQPDPGKLPQVNDTPRATNKPVVVAPAHPHPTGPVFSPTGTNSLSGPGNSTNPTNGGTKPTKTRVERVEKAMPVNPEDYRPPTVVPVPQPRRINPADAGVNTFTPPQDSGSVVPPPFETTNLAVPRFPEGSGPDIARTPLDFPPQTIQADPPPTPLPTPPATNFVHPTPQGDPPVVAAPVPVPVPVDPPPEAPAVIPELTEVLVNAMPAVIPPQLPEVITIKALQTATMSAFDAREVAAAQLKDATVSSKLMRVEGIRSTVSVAPTEWRFYFYDSSANENYRRVDVINGKALPAKEGIPYANAFSYAYGVERIMPSRLLRVDSTQVLQAIKAHKSMAGVTVTASSFSLDNKETAPVWKVKLFGSTLKKPKSRDLGEVWVFVETGQVYNTARLKLD